LDAIVKLIDSLDRRQVRPHSLDLNAEQPQLHSGFFNVRAVRRDQQVRALLRGDAGQFQADPR
jgi:hypothetical protein